MKLMRLVAMLLLMLLFKNNGGMVVSSFGHQPTKND